MSQRNTNVSLRHMLDHALEAVAMTKGKTRADLDKDRQLNLALVRLLEIIGEAASRIPKEEQAHSTDISWSEIVSLRNRLIHGYDTVDFDILWQIVKQDLPGLIESLKKILDEESEG
jgi:uncharacterized protein with HEPN domain